MEERKIKFRLTYTRIIALSFFCVIVTGTFLLCLPISSNEGVWTSPLDAGFTAVSAACVTGLVVVNTSVYWSLFGQAVILALIQIGGLGLMTLISVFSILMNRQIGLQEKRLLMQSAGNLKLAGMTGLIKKIILGTLLAETLGAVLLAFRFCSDFSFGKGIWLAVFHSVSAFCNAGFDLLGQFGQSSFTSYVNDPFVMLILMLLIITGGLGFFVWDDVIKNKFRFKKMTLHTKLVLVTSAFLIVGGAVFFFFSEASYSMKGMSAPEKLLAAMFQSVTTRTAGFNSVDQAALSESGSLCSLVLMLVGGSPGSTAGGIKTTTLAVIVASTFYAGRNVGDVNIFKRKLSGDTVRQASAVLHVYLLAVIASVCAICALEPITLRESLFEVVSAIGTVGLTMNVTPTLGAAARILLMILMYAGRIGGLSMVMVFAEKRDKVQLNRPSEKILIG